MEILKYTSEHRQFRHRLKGFLEKKIVPNIEHWEDTGRIPKSVWKTMGAQGFLCTEVSTTFGGLGGDFLYSVIVAEELAGTNFAGLMAYVHSDIIVPYITSYASEEIKRKYLPGCVSGEIITAIAMSEPGAGSDLSRIETTAVEKGDHVVINGVKTFISNALNCDIAIVAAKNSLEIAPYDAVSLYIVEADTPGFKKGKKLNKMGYHSQDTAELFFTDCKVPIANRLGSRGKGFSLLMQELQRERLMIAIFALAGAENIFEKTVAHCKTARDAGRPLSHRQSIRFMLVEMATRLKLGRTFIDKLIADHMDGKHIVAETSMAKYWITDMAKQTADMCMDIFGPYGSLAKCPVERFWRDVRVMPIFAGTNEIMKKIIARRMGL
jgi:acyl-CoA dehydrogenase